MEQVKVKCLIRPFTSSTIIKSATLSGGGCNQGHISIIKSQRAELPYFLQNNWLTTFTSSLLRQPCVGLIHATSMPACASWHHTGPGKLDLGWEKKWTTLTSQLSIASHKLRTISDGTGKGQPSKRPIETPSQRAAYEFQVRQINPYMFVVQPTRNSHANLWFVII